MRYLLFAYAMGFAIIGAMTSYLSEGKEHFLSDALLRDIMERMGRDLADAADNYLDLPDSGRHSALGIRMGPGLRDIKNLATDEQLFPPIDYDSIGDTNPNPSIRDQEYLQHSSVWGNQYVSGGAGEGKQLLKPDGSIKNHQEVKTDANLPAYCNPPNPCPLGYEEHQGCINACYFENTAAYSRHHQASQDCMCDSEHMFECPSTQDSDIRRTDGMVADAISEMEFNRFLQQSIQNNEHKTMVAKKFFIGQNREQQQNPYLFGERLPVAAKKGTNVEY